jgi:very-short-patch-repair endonuclease
MQYLHMAGNQMYEIAKELRKRPTISERVLWEMLRSRKLNGHRFLRQRPISFNSRTKDGDFIVADFYCHASKLIVEVDGDIHEFQKPYDHARDDELFKMGFKVIRFHNDEILHDMSYVLQKIM